MLLLKLLKSQLLSKVGDKVNMFGYPAGKFGASLLTLLWILLNLMVKVFKELVIKVDNQVLAVAVSLTRMVN